MTSTQGFHVIMNLFLVPMWFTSGALFPAAGAAWPMRVVMAVNPLTYGLSGLRDCLYRTDPAATVGVAPLWVCLPVSVALAAALFALATADRPPPHGRRPDLSVTRCPNTSKSILVAMWVAGRAWPSAG